MGNIGGEFRAHLLNFTSSDLSANSISALNSLVDSADSRTRQSFLPQLEEAANKFKQQKVVPGLADFSGGFSPLAKVVVEVGNGGNFAHRERAFAALVQLVAKTSEKNVREEAGLLAQMALEVIGKKVEEEGEERQPNEEVREAALHALKATLDKFPVDLPQNVFEQFAKLQAALLAILPDKSNEPIRQLSADCMGRLVNFHPDPGSLFSLLSDMSSDCELMLKDDPLLDDLFDKTMGRENELNEKAKNKKSSQVKNNGGEMGKKRRPSIP